MNPKALAVMTLRALAQLFTLQGEPRAAQTFTKTADLIDAGADVDEHMARVAEVLNSDGPIDWDDVEARIRTSHEELMAR